MFENLSERLERSFKILKGEGKITEINVAETLKDVRKALLDADVNYKVAKTFTDTVKQKALGMNVLTAVKPGQRVVIGEDQASVLGVVSHLINTMGLALTSIQGRLEHKTKQAIVEFNIRLTSRRDLETLITKLKEDPKVFDVYRTNA